MIASLFETIKELNKQKEPVIKETEIGTYQFLCPRCREKVAWGYQYRTDKCYNCGQRINWSGYPEPSEDDSLDNNWITEAVRTGKLLPNHREMNVQRYEARVTR